MLNKNFRQTAGSFEYDSYEVVFKSKAGKIYECSGVEIDFDAEQIVIKQRADT